MDHVPDKLINAYLEGELDENQAAELSAWVMASKENARYLASLTSLEHGLTKHARVRSSSDILAELEQAQDEAAASPWYMDLPSLPPKVAIDPDKLTKEKYIFALAYVINHTFTPKRIAKLAAAAALLLGVALAIVLLTGPDETHDSQEITDNTAIDPNKPAASTESTPRGSDPVATLTAEHDAQWAEGALAPGSPLRAGQQLTLTAGFAEITTNRGAVAILEAPCTVELTDNDNAIRLHAGKLVGICETELSQGFVVKTDYADITDLGTEFGVEVANSQLTTTVFAGKVVLNTPGSAPQPLVANQTATLTDSTGARLVVQKRVAEGFTLRLPSTATAEQIQSTATPIAAWDFFGQDTQAGVYSGDISTASGLQMTGFTGQWGTMPASQGALIVNRKAIDVGETTGVCNGITLRWAVDGVGATHWAFVHPENSHALFGDCYFILNPSRWGGAAIPWRIEGLTPGARYDLIFFGRNSNHYDEALIAINGHDAGNGVGAAATLDDEDDANFQSVVADADGFISGTFSALENGKHAVVTGVQIGLLPGPGNPRPNTNP